MASPSDASSTSSEESFGESDDSECSFSPMMQPLLNHPALQYQRHELPESLHAAWLELLVALSARSVAYDINHLSQENTDQHLQANMELSSDEEWTRRFQARLYSVVLIKSKSIHQHYIADVPKHLRHSTMPQTPRCDMRNISTGKWRYDIIMWDRDLKQWYKERNRDLEAFTTTTARSGGRR